MNKGFTLMEVLAVVMVLAILGLMAVPSFRSVNSEQKFRRAKISMVKLAQAIKSVQTRTGQSVSSAEADNSFVGTDNSYLLTEHEIVKGVDCPSTGIPARSIAGGAATLVLQDLFKCGDLRPKDFVGLPYEFAYTGTSVTMEGKPGAGKKYYNEENSEHPGVVCGVSMDDLSTIVGDSVCQIQS